MVRAAGTAANREIPYEVVDRRSGDIAECYADPSLAEKALGWRATRGLDRMCADSWRWQLSNPDGYAA
jgi:UDP-glucose 4-epimerase